MIFIDQINIDQLYHALLSYFGNPTYGFTVAVVEALKQAYLSKEYSTIVAFAVQEGFNLSDFSI